MTLFTYVRIFAEYSPSVAGDTFGHYIWCVNGENDGPLNGKLTLFTYVRIFGEYSPSVAGDAFGHYIWCVNPQNDGPAG